MDVQTSPRLNKQIQSFIDEGLKAVGLARDVAVMQTTGDGAILVFDQPSVAHEFATAVNQLTQDHNEKKPAGIGKRVFRIGVATGDLVMEPKPNGGFEIAGMTIARAVRLEAKAAPGEVLCDLPTFAKLKPAQKKRYSAVETISGKRQETFEGRRCILNPAGMSDAGFFMSQAKTGPPSERTRSSGVADLKLVRREILSLFQQMIPSKFDDLIFLLNIPISRRPPNTLDLEGKKNHLLMWASESTDDLEDLLAELRIACGFQEKLDSKITIILPSEQVKKRR